MQVSLETLRGDMRDVRGGHHIYLGLNISRIAIPWALGAHYRIMDKDLLLIISIGLGLGAYIHWETYRAYVWCTCLGCTLFQGALHRVSIYDEMSSRASGTWGSNILWIGDILLLTILDAAAMTCDMEIILVRIEMGRWCDTAEMDKACNMGEILTWVG